MKWTNIKTHTMKEYVEYLVEEVGSLKLREELYYYFGNCVGEVLEIFNVHSEKQEILGIVYEECECGIYRKKYGTYKHTTSETVVIKNLTRAEMLEKLYDYELK